MILRGSLRFIICQPRSLCFSLVVSMNSFYSLSYEELGGTTGQAILSRFPLWDGQIVSLPQSRNIAAAATIEVNGVLIRLFSIHLSSTLRAGWTFAKEAPSERTREATRSTALVKEANSHGGWGRLQSQARSHTASS
jgi:hypothetical protein